MRRLEKTIEGCIQTNAATGSIEPPLSLRNYLLTRCGWVTFVPAGGFALTRAGRCGCGSNTSSVKPRGVMGSAGLAIAAWRRWRGK